MDHTALHAELVNDPESLGYAPLVASGNDQGLADLLNKRPEAYSPAKDWTATRAYIPMAKVLTWAAAGPLDALNGGLSSEVSQIRSACRGALLLFSLPSLDSFNPSLVATLLAGLVSAGVLTSDQSAALTTLQQVPASRAEVLFGVGSIVSIHDLSFAQRGV